MQEIEAIKNEKNQVLLVPPLQLLAHKFAQMQRLLNQISMSRDEDQRRWSEDLKRMSEDLERKEKDLTDLRSEVDCPSFSDLIMYRFSGCQRKIEA